MVSKNILGIWIFIVILILESRATEKITTDDKLGCKKKRKMEEEIVIPIDIYSRVLKYLVGSKSHWYYLQTCRRVNSAYNTNVFSSHMKSFEHLHTYKFVHNPDPEQLDQDVSTMAEYITFYKKMLKLAFIDAAILPDSEYLLSHKIMSKYAEDYVEAKYNIQAQVFSYVPVNSMLRREWIIPLPVMIILQNKYNSEYRIEVLFPELMSEIAISDKDNQRKSSFYFTYRRSLFQYTFLYFQREWEEHDCYFAKLEYSGSSQEVKFELVYAAANMPRHFRLSPEMSLLPPSTCQDPWFIKKIEFLNQSRENVIDWDPSKYFNQNKE